MISVSDAWKANQQGLLVSESFVEITFVGTTPSEDIVFNKSNITKYKHEQDGCLLSGKLPTNKITFSVDNLSLDDKLDGYNPNTANFTKNQKITVRYGFTVNGNIEWIKAGTFYLTEWNTPANGMETTFEARDLLAFFMDKPYIGRTSGTLYQIVESAVGQAGIPQDVVVEIDGLLGGYYTTIATEWTLAEILQLCANAACCVIWQDRDGKLRIQRVSNVKKDSDNKLKVQHVSNMTSDYVIPTAWAYTYPEYEVSKPIKAIQLAYGNNKVEDFPVADIGETQSISNELITQKSQANEVAQWVAALLKDKKTISGEFRADPRLDVFDKVTVESKYGVNEAVIITNITYNFTGSFRSTYGGYVTKFDETITKADYFCGELYCGEV